MVSTHLKNISQNRHLPQIGMLIKNIWNHHLVFLLPTNLFFSAAQKRVPRDERQTPLAVSDAVARKTPLPRAALPRQKSHAKRQAITLTNAQVHQNGRWWDMMTQLSGFVWISVFLVFYSTTIREVFNGLTCNSSNASWKNHWLWLLHVKTSFSILFRGWYCWWKTSGTSWYDTVNIPEGLH